MLAVTDDMLLQHKAGEDRLLAVFLVTCWSMGVHASRLAFRVFMKMLPGTLTGGYLLHFS